VKDITFVKCLAQCLDTRHTCTHVLGWQIYKRHKKPYNESRQGSKTVLSGAW